MLFDDRLVTVLGTLPGGAAAARTQYRQLIDLIGSATGGADTMDLATYRRLAAQAAALSLADRERMIGRPALASRNHRLLTFLGWQRLEELSAIIPAEERSRILREPGLRLRNPHLVALLAEGDAKPAAAALATARLSDGEWQDLIPRLPVMARGFLRHRRDLPDGAREQLRQLGVSDLVLPLPEGFEPDIEATPPVTQPQPAPQPAEEGDGIRALLRRIEAFREGRRAAPVDPRLPLGDMAEESQHAPLTQFAFTADQQGRIDWAEGPVAPLVCGMRLGEQVPGAVAVLAAGGVRAMRNRQPLDAAVLTIDALPAISGEWRVDAEPVFAAADRRFNGYRGRIRRPVLAAVPAPQPQTDSAQDRMRQVLHELRTPVNAIQGFAEIIQQQLFGHAPNAYRAHAAAIAVDAARLLAGFEEIDRLSKLESGAMELDAGEADLTAELAETIRRMEGVLRARSAGFDMAPLDSPCLVALHRDEVRLLCWRVLASLAGALAPGERLAVHLTAGDDRAHLAVTMPQAMLKQDDPFAAGPADQKSALSAGMFGQGFALRLARAEAVAAGGDMAFADGMLQISLPLLTAN